MTRSLPHQPWLYSPSATNHMAVERALRATQPGTGTHDPWAISPAASERVLLARTLAVQAPVLLMDEPLANPDPPHQSDWLGIVGKLVQQGMTVVSVLHELSMALHADDMVVMAGGRVLHHGAAHAPDTHAAIEQVFDKRLSIHALADQWVVLPRL